jgi:hypothetical protein
VKGKKVDEGRKEGRKEGKKLSLSSSVSTLLNLALLSLVLSSTQSHFRLRLIFLGMWIILLLFCCGLSVRRKEPQWKGILLLQVLVIAALEFASMFISQSHGRSDYVLSMRNWGRHNFKPINAAGYRDFELDPVGDESKRKIVVLGDSVVAGQGIDKIEDRFSDRLGQRLGSDYRVFNVAVCGWGPKEELKALTDFPYDPDDVILTYFPNDIAFASAKQGHSYQAKTDFDKLNRLASYFVKNSYLVNYIYFNFPETSEGDYFGFLKEAYSNQEILKDHFAELDGIIEETKRRKSKLLFLPVPMMENIELSKTVMAPVMDHFRNRGVPIVEVTSAIAKLPFKERLASRTDPHPSISVQKIIADALYASLSNSKLGKND